MTLDGRSGADNRTSTSSLSRRCLLAALGGIGAVGAASGAGTFAHFSDTASFAGNEMGAGEVDIDVTGPVDEIAPGEFGFSVDGIKPGVPGDESFVVSVRTNPARLWLATRCPDLDEIEEGGLLAEFLQVSLSVGGEVAFPTGGSGAGSLGDLRRALVEGTRIDEECLAPDENLGIVLEWELPHGTPTVVADQTAGLTLRLYTEQCRHVSEDTAAGSNPFVGSDPCPEPPCAVCEDGNGELQTLTLRYLGSETADLVVTGKGGSWATSGKVAFNDSVGSGETFTIDATDLGENRLPRNLYFDSSGGSGDEPDENTEPADPGNSGNAGGRNGRPDHPGDANNATGVNIHTSCSELLEPGMKFGNFEVVSATTAAGERLCDSTDEHDDEENDEPEENASDCGVCGDDNGTRLRDLSFKYLGDADATIEVSTKRTGSGSDPVVFGPETVESGQTFFTDGSDVPQNWNNGSSTGSLGPNTYLEIIGGGDPGATTNVEIHTSCSDPVEVGDTLGADGSGSALYELVAGTTTQGESLCGSEEN